MPALLATVMRFRIGFRLGIAPTSRRARTALVVGLAVAVAAGFYPWRSKQGHPSAEPVLSSSARSSLEQCTEAALLLHDVRWAASCMVQAQQDALQHASCLREATEANESGRRRDLCDSRYLVGDGSAECELPGARAATLYELLHRAEQRCLSEAGVVRR